MSIQPHSVFYVGFVFDSGRIKNKTKMGSCALDRFIGWGIEKFVDVTGEDTRYIMYLLHDEKTNEI